jgi:hypothetical protein
MDDQRDYAEEAANRADMAREAGQEAEQDQFSAGQDAFGRIYDKGYASGHRDGYWDAREKLFDMAQAAGEAGDTARQTLLMDIWLALRPKQES